MTSQQSGLIAILRGLPPADAEDVGHALYAAGFRCLEVPLNSPDPYVSIRRLRESLPMDCAVGAGTVLEAADVSLAQEAGANMIVSPNTNPAVIRATITAGMHSYPGVATPTEAFTALEAGASSLKLFPSQAVGISGLKAWQAVLPPDVAMLPVGGIDAGNLAQWVAAGAAGAGIGTSLYLPGRSSADIATRATALVDAWAEAATISRLDRQENL